MTQTVNAPAKIRKRSTPLHFGLCLARDSGNISTAVICTCMHMLCVPTVLIFMLVNISEIVNGNRYASRFSIYSSSMEPYMTIACIALVIAVLLGSNAAMNSFSHLYDKQKVDMELSLPLSDKQRFVSGYLSGLGVYILPYIAVQIISLILFLAGHLAFDGKSVRDQYDGSYMVIDEFEKYFPYYAKLAAGGLFIMIMFYTMWVLTMTFCGSKLEAVLYGAGANLIMPAVYGSAAILINDVMYGAVIGSYFIPNKGNISGILFACTSPAGAVIALAENVTKESEQSMLGFIFPLVIVTAVFFAAAMYVYCRRKAEDTGKSFVVKGFYYFVLTCMVFFIFTALTVNDIGIIPVIIVSGAAYIILDCISERGVKKIWLSCIRYAVTTAVCAGLYFLVSATDCFGAAYRVPEISQISSVSIGGYNGIFNNISAYNDSMYTFTGEDAAGIITDMHRTQLDLHRNDHEINEFVFSDGLPYYIKYHTVRLTYTLKNGSKIHRQYRVYKNAWEKLMPLNAAEEAKENRIRDIRTRAESIKDLENGQVSIYGRFEPSFDYRYDNKKSVRLPDDFAEKFAQCAEEDIRALTLEEYIHPERASYGSITVTSETAYGGSLSMQLPAYFKSTAKYLYSIGLDFDSINDIGTHFANYIYEGDHSQNIYIYRYDPDISDTELLLCIRNNSAYDCEESPEPDIGIKDMKTLDILGISEIFANSIDGYIPESECYTIFVDGLSEYAYYIPERYNSTVEDILEKYNSYTN